MLEARAVSRAPPFVTSRGALNDGNCRLTMPVGKGRCARDALPQAFHIGVFKFVFTISTAIKHIYMNLHTYLKVVMLLVTPVIAGISNKRC